MVNKELVIGNYSQWKLMSNHESGPQCHVKALGFVWDMTNSKTAMKNYAKRRHPKVSMVSSI